VVAAQVLLVYSRPGCGQVAFLLEEIDTILASFLNIFFVVLGDPWRVELDVGWDESFFPIYKKKGV
jgi:hypothetical protein